MMTAFSNKFCKINKLQRRRRHVHPRVDARLPASRLQQHRGRASKSDDDNDAVNFIAVEELLCLSGDDSWKPSLNNHKALLSQFAQIWACSFLGWEPWPCGYLEETHVLKVVGSNPSIVYWMDIFHICLW